MKTLENEKIWVCWYYSTRKGKRTKVPIAASGCTTGTDESYRCTWVTKAEAQKAAAEKHHDGIGFVLPPGYFFFDIDCADDTGAVLVLCGILREWKWYPYLRQMRHIPDTDLYRWKRKNTAQS